MKRYDTFHIELDPETKKLFWVGQKDPGRRFPVFCHHCNLPVRRGRESEGEDTSCMYCPEHHGLPWLIPLDDFGFANDGVCAPGFSSFRKDNIAPILYRMAERESCRAWAGEKPSWGCAEEERELARQIERERRCEIMENQAEEADFERMEWSVSITSIAVDGLPNGYVSLGIFRNKADAVNFIKTFRKGLASADSVGRFDIGVRASSNWEYRNEQK